MCANQTRITYNTHITISHICLPSIIISSLTCADLLRHAQTQTWAPDPSLGLSFDALSKSLLYISRLVKCWMFCRVWVMNCTFLNLVISSPSSWKFWSLRSECGIYSLHLLFKMLQELKVGKGVVHAVLNQALSKVVAVLSVLSEMALRLLD